MRERKRKRGTCVVMFIAVGDGTLQPEVKSWASLFAFSHSINDFGKGMHQFFRQ